MAYEKPSITGYNTSAPIDNGVKTEDNKVKWSTIKGKLSDPVKVYADAINEAVDDAFSNLYPITDSETSASVEPSDYAYPPGDVRRYGAVIDGATDDTVAFQNACKAGIDVTVPEGTAILSGALVFSVAGQRIIGAGLTLTTLKFSGNFDCVTFSTSGGLGGGIDDLKIDASGMTGGYTLVVNHASHTLFRNFRGASGYNGLHVVQANTTTFVDCSFEAYTGTYIVYLDGTTQRSDVFRAFGLILRGNNSDSGASSPNYIDGFVVDGNFNTIQVYSLIITRCLRGIRYINSASTTAPSFARFYDFEGDLSNNQEQVRLEVGDDIHFTDSYIHGSEAADNVYIANGVTSTFLIGCRITAAYKRGIYFAGQRLKVIGCHVGGNSQAGVASYAAITCAATATDFEASGSNTGINISTTQKHSYGLEILAGALRINWHGDLSKNVTASFVDNTTTGFGNVVVIDTGGGDSIVGGVRFTKNGTQTPLIQGYSTAVTSPAMQLMAQNAGLVEVGNAQGTGFKAGSTSGTIVNWIRSPGSATGSPVLLLAEGSDSNIDLELFPKGTGIVRVGYATSSALTPSNFTADKILAFKDATGSTFYIPCRSSTW